MIPRNVFDFEIKDDKHEDLYKVIKVPYKKDDLKLLMKALKSKNFYDDYNDNSFRKGSGGWGAENGKMQRIMFKCSVGYKMGQHDKYINTYMPQKDKETGLEKPELFGTDDEEYKANKVDRHFKFIISPENQDVNLECLTHEMIKRIEIMTGLKLYWKAAIHNDTNHRHVHVCINGKDKKGKVVYFQPEFIKRTIRETLSYVATLLVGERTEREIQAAREGLVTSKRWTKTDDEIMKLGNTINTSWIPVELANRLEYLAELQLAEKTQTGYRLKDEWQEVLMATGRYNTYFTEYINSNGELQLYSGQHIKGTVEKIINFDKDESWIDAIIVRTDEGLIYVPIWQLKRDNIVGRNIEIAEKGKALSRNVTNRDIHLLRKKRGGLSI